MPEDWRSAVIVGLLRNYPEAGSGGEGAPTAGECAVA